MYTYSFETVICHFLSRGILCQEGTNGVQSQTIFSIKNIVNKLLQNLCITCRNNSLSHAYVERHVTANW